MQYILTEEEYKELVPKEKLYDLLDEIQKLNEHVLELSNRICEYKDGCGYCDGCPIGKDGTNTCLKVGEYKIGRELQ